IYSSRPAISIALFVLVGACFYGFQPCFWAVPTLFLSESAAAASIGLINSVGELGGFDGRFVIGYVDDRAYSIAPELFSLFMLLFFLSVVIDSLLACAATASFCLINSVGNLGGFAGPFVIGYLANRTHSFAPGLWYLVISLFVSGALILAVGVPKSRESRTA